MRRQGINQHTHPHVYTALTVTQTFLRVLKPCSSCLITAYLSSRLPTGVLFVVTRLYLLRAQIQAQVRRCRRLFVHGLTVFVHRKAHSYLRGILVVSSQDRRWKDARDLASWQHLLAAAAACLRAALLHEELSASECAGLCVAHVHPRRGQASSLSSSLSWPQSRRSLRYALFRAYATWPARSNLIVLSTQSEAGPSCYITRRRRIRLEIVSVAAARRDCDGWYHVSDTYVASALYLSERHRLEVKRRTLYRGGRTADQVNGEDIARKLLYRRLSVGVSPALLHLSRSCSYGVLSEEPAKKKALVDNAGTRRRSEWKVRMSVLFR